MSRYTDDPVYRMRINRINAKYYAKTKEERAVKQIIYRNKPEVKARYAANRKKYYCDNKYKFCDDQKNIYNPKYRFNAELDNIILHEEQIKTDDNCLDTEFMLKMVMK